jgi:ABC-2 type transport system ATP-binding protein
MGQRLGIAAALLGDPEILMFDEPVNGLDPEGIHWIRNLMKGLATQGRTVFVSSHLMSEMALTADHLIVIGRGRLLADTSMAEFIERNSRSYVRVRTPQPEQFRDVLAAAGHAAAATQDGAFEIAGVEAAELGDLAAEHRVTLHELSPQRASLEEAFMQLTAESVEYHAHGAIVPGAGAVAGGPPVPQAPPVPAAPQGQFPQGQVPQGQVPQAPPVPPPAQPSQPEQPGQPAQPGQQQPGQQQWGAQWRNPGQGKRR